MTGLDGVDAELESLIDQAKAAAPNEKIDFRDPIARFGDRAIEKILPLVEEKQHGWFAVRVICATVRFGVPPQVATAALWKAAGMAPDSTAALDASLCIVKLGGAPIEWPNRWRERGNRSYLKSKDRWHLVDGEIAGSSKRFLTACGRWESEGYVNENGGIQREVPAGEACENCDRAAAKGFPVSKQTWKVETMPTASGSPVTHMWKTQDRRHIVKGGQALESAGHGVVFLTNCGWFVRRDRVVEVRRGATSRTTGLLCENCLPSGEPQ